jgi:hypothetical protein
VPSLLDTPQKRDGHPSPEQVNSLDGDVPEAYSPSRVRAGDGMGRTRASGFMVCPKVPNYREGSLFIGNRRREGKSLRQEMNRLAAERDLSGVKASRPRGLVSAIDDNALLP